MKNDFAFPLSWKLFLNPESRQLSPGVGGLSPAADTFPVAASLQGRLKTHLPHALHSPATYSLDLCS